MRLPIIPKRWRTFVVLCALSVVVLLSDMHQWRIVAMILVLDFALTLVSTSRDADDKGLQ